MPRVEPNISREKLFEQIGYTPHSEGQWAAHRDQSRFRVVCCGRRWGKSLWAGHEDTLKMFVPDSINWIVAPEYELGEKEFRVVHKDFKTLKLLDNCNVAFNVRSGRMSIYFKPLNSLLVVKSSQRPDSLVGEALDHVTFSEAAKHDRAVWEMYIRPALQDRHGSADFPSTPQGFNWYKGMYDVGQDPDYVDYSSHRFPSWENPVVFPEGRNDPEILDVERIASPMFFEQEIAAKFTAFEGQIYPEFNPDIHVDGSFDYNPAWKNWLAMDFGYTDPFIALDIMIDPSNRVYVWREYSVSYKSTYDHGHILKQREQPEGYHVDQMVGDPRGADEAATLAWILGGMLQRPVGWGLGIEAIKRALKVREDGSPGLLIHPRCKILIQQMQQLRSRTAKEGHNSKEGQHDYFDHCCDALRYFFSEYFVLGGGESLKELYTGRQIDNEAEGFFKVETGITLTEANDMVRW